MTPYELTSQLIDEAAAYFDEAIEACRESINPRRNLSVKWEELSERRIRAALALLGFPMERK